MLKIIDSPANQNPEPNKHSLDDLQKREDELGKQALKLKDDILTKRNRIRTLENDLNDIEKGLNDPKIVNKDTLLERKQRTELLITLINDEIKKLQQQQQEMLPTIKQFKRAKRIFQENEKHAEKAAFALNIEEQKRKLLQEISTLQDEIKTITQKLEKYPKNLTYADGQRYYKVAKERGDLLEERGKISRLLKEKEEELEKIKENKKITLESKPKGSAPLSERIKETEINPQDYVKLNFIEIFQLPLPTIETLIKIVAQDRDSGKRLPGYRRTQGEVLVDSKIRQHFIGHNTASIPTSKDWEAVYSPLFIKKLNTAKYMRERTQNLNENQKEEIFKLLSLDYPQLKEKFKELELKVSKHLQNKSEWTEFDRISKLIIEKELERRET